MFDIGQHVVCVENSVDARGRPIGGLLSELLREGLVLPTIGKVYTVRNTIVVKADAPIGLLLAEIINSDDTYGGRIFEKAFPANWFRPLQRLRVEDFVNTEAPVDGVPA